MIMEKLRISERRACKVLDQWRATQRRRRPESQWEEGLITRMVELAIKFRRWGYKKITGLLRDEGWRVNKKRILRLWRQEGLKVIKKRRKKRRLWLSDGTCIRIRPNHANHIWAYDFVEDRTSDGRKLRFLTVVDEYTRVCLALKVGRSLKAEDVQICLKDLFIKYGVPEFIRSDNGSEFTADMVRIWLQKLGVRTIFIEPGSPWENGFSESFNGIFRDEFLNGELLDTLWEAKVLAEDWRRTYNAIRPHGSLKYRPPAPEAVEPRPGKPSFATLRSFSPA
jgi:transposase InsO family protein